MKLLQKFFGGKKPIREVQFRQSNMSFIGPPNGPGAPILVAEFTEILKKESAVDRAYLSGIRYGEGEKVRVALVLSISADPTKVATTVGGACASAGLHPIDILFLDTLGAEHQRVFAEVAPFYAK